MSVQKDGKLHISPAVALSGGSLAIIEAGMNIAHQGVVGAVVGIGGGWLVYETYKHFAKEGGREISLPLPHVSRHEKKPGELSWWYRATTPKDFREDAESVPEQQQSSPTPPLHIRLSDTLIAHINTILSNRIAILGMPGAGKSNLVAVLCEALARFGVPLIIFDTKPEYAGMCAEPYFQNPYRASVKNVTPGNARVFGKQILNDRLQVVLNLRSYKDDNAAALVMIGIIEGIWEYEEARKKHLPCMVVLDEAHYWLSQGQQMNNVSRKEDKETGLSLYSRLQTTFFNLVNIGRSFGMGSIIATQRPANIDKRAIAPAEWKFLLKANQPQDISAYKDYGFGEDARKLGKGQVYVIGPEPYAEGSVHQIIKRQSPDEAETPGYENLLQEDGAEVSPEDVDELISNLAEIDPDDSRYSSPASSFERHVPYTSPVQDRGFPEVSYENERTVKEPLEPDEIDESFNERDETFIASHEDEMAILMAVIDLQNAGKKVTREAIKIKLKWNNAKHPVLKAVCDKHKIAVR